MTGRAEGRGEGDSLSCHIYLHGLPEAQCQGLGTCSLVKAPREATFLRTLAR